MRGEESRRDEMILSPSSSLLYILPILYNAVLMYSTGPVVLVFLVFGYGIGLFGVVWRTPNLMTRAANYPNYCIYCRCIRFMLCRDPINDKLKKVYRFR